MSLKTTRSVRKPSLVREIRRITGLTVGEFAKATGLAPVTVNFLSNGRKEISGTTAQKICLGVGARLHFNKRGNYVRFVDAFSGSEYTKKSYERWKEISDLPPEVYIQQYSKVLSSLTVLLQAAYRDSKYLVAQDALIHAMVDVIDKLGLDKSFELAMSDEKAREKFAGVHLDDGSNPLGEVLKAYSERIDSLDRASASD